MRAAVPLGVVANTKSVPLGRKRQSVMAKSTFPAGKLELVSGPLKQVGKGAVSSRTSRFQSTPSAARTPAAGRSAPNGGGTLNRLRLGVTAVEVPLVRAAGAGHWARAGATPKRSKVMGNTDRTIERFMTAFPAEGRDVADQ